MTVIEYLLTCLIEEGAEIQQRATKAQRFGLFEVQSGQKKTNRDRLEYEFLDQIAVIELLDEQGVVICDMTSKRARRLIDKKKRKVKKFLEYSKTLGVIER